MYKAAKHVLQHPAVVVKETSERVAGNFTHNPFELVSQEVFNLPVFLSSPFELRIQQRLRSQWRPLRSLIGTLVRKAECLLGGDHARCYPGLRLVLCGYGRGCLTFQVIGLLRARSALLPRRIERRVSEVFVLAQSPSSLGSGPSLKL